MIHTGVLVVKGNFIRLLCKDTLVSVGVLLLISEAGDNFAILPANLTGLLDKGKV